MKSPYFRYFRLARGAENTSEAGEACGQALLHTLTLVNSLVLSTCTVYVPLGVQYSALFMNGRAPVNWSK